jgi:hypothetical protein
MHPTDLTLNDYVDRALGDSERAGVERHLEQCPECRALADDLREIRRATKALTPMEPPAVVWRRIERTIRQDASAEATGAGNVGAGSAFTPRRLGWLAAAAVLVLATFVGLRLGPLAPRQPASSPPAASAPAASSDAAESVESELRQAEEHYDKAIKGLEQIADAGEGALDPKTAATLKKNLSVIDQAISESRAAVRSEPNSEPAQASLLDAFKTKVSLLQDTVSLINEMRKGNDAGAARIVSGLKQKG